jgi:signal peptidase I
MKNEHHERTAGLERQAMAWPMSAAERARAFSDDQAPHAAGAGAGARFGARSAADSWAGPGASRGQPGQPDIAATRTSDTGSAGSRPSANLRDVIETIGLTLLIAAGIQFAVQSRQIEGSSMEPTLHNGQRLLVNRLAYQSPNEAQRGDIIVFRAWDQDEDYIKRVVGVPGDEIDIRDNHIRVNGFLLDEPYIANEPTFGTPDTVILGPGEYYVLGDNRGNSSDSRLHGPLPAGKIIGKAWLTYWPLDNLGFISDTTSYAAPSPGVPADPTPSY